VLSSSPNTAYVLLAPHWDPFADGGPSTPTSFVLLQSSSGFAIHLNETLHIAVNDKEFVGNCGASSFLTQEQADFMTMRVFADVFKGRSYNAATCMTSGAP
jgi:hypothetical protein